MTVLMSTLLLLGAYAPAVVPFGDGGPPSPSAGPSAGEFQLAQAEEELPTLEEAIFIESSVDRNTVYLGEAVNLTLTYGQLDFRGIRVQSHYKTRRIRLPDTEGFFAGKIIEESRKLTRDGHAYTLTVYRVPLFPTQPGALFIGAWRWQGTARGYTVSGAQSLQIDRSTSPLTINVEPLPPAPAGFGGAVGRFELDTAIANTQLMQGVPITYTVEISGEGNPQSLRPPTLPQALWYRLGDGTVTGETEVTGTNPEFMKRYEYELMPLQDGVFTLGPVAFTYFSPREKQYVTTTGPVLEVTVAESDLEERLVVVGGVGHGEAGALLVMDDGRLPLATTADLTPASRRRGGMVYFLGIVPIGLFLVALLVLWGLSNRRVSPDGALRRVRLHNGAQEAASLRGVILAEIEQVTATKISGLTTMELEAALSSRGWGEAACALGAGLRACDAVLYGGAAMASEELLALADRAAYALDVVDSRETGQ